MKKLKVILLSATTFLLCGLLLKSCAVQADPLGGPKDEIAPEPDSLASTKNNQLFFEKQAIKLVFNEWVTLKNENQIIVSPPLEHGLNVKLKKKTLVLDFDEEEQLLDNTTYTINLGQSIVDYTVGNPMDNYTFVFSTGAYIDSLSIKGKVIDDFTGEPVENVIVSLYADLQDSAAYKSRPLYFTRTSEEGTYQINNIRTDSFNLVAIDDKNVNYFKDQESEKIGFFDSIIYLDTLINKADIGIFQPEAMLRIKSKEQSKGELKLTLNKEVDSLSYNIIAGEDIVLKIFRDTAYLWHEGTIEREIIMDPLGAADTIILKSVTDTLLQKKKPSFTLVNTSKSIPMSPYDSLILRFNTPVQTFDGSLFSIIDTAKISIKTQVVQDLKDPRILKVKATWIEGQNHTVRLLQEAYSTILGSLKDTISTDFVVGRKKSLGEIVFELDSLNENMWYLVEIKQGENRIEKIVKQKKSATVSFQGLKAGKYTTRITEDTNRNGRWDAGEFFSRKRSERWIKKELESLKPNWTLEIKIDGAEFK